MKPVLDNMTNLVVESLSGEARSFYDREFTFFQQVTSISGKLRPYIKRPKPEKKASLLFFPFNMIKCFFKAKIDEEMAKIRVDVGVYLPSNPDGKVVDIDKLSGRPLQSHAKVNFIPRVTRTAGLTIFSGSFYGYIQSEEGTDCSRNGSRGLTGRFWR